MWKHWGKFNSGVNIYVTWLHTIEIARNTGFVYSHITWPDVGLYNLLTFFALVSSLPMELLYNKGIARDIDFVLPECTVSRRGIAKVRYTSRLLDRGDFYTRYECSYNTICPNITKYWSRKLIRYIKSHTPTGRSWNRFYDLNLSSDGCW